MKVKPGPAWLGSQSYADLVRVLEAAGAVGNGYGHTHRGMVRNEAPALHEALALYDEAEHIDGSRCISAKSSAPNDQNAA